MPAELLASLSCEGLVEFPWPEAELLSDTSCDVPEAEVELLELTCSLLVSTSECVAKLSWLESDTLPLSAASSDAEELELRPLVLELTRSMLASESEFRAALLSLQLAALLLSAESDGAEVVESAPLTLELGSLPSGSSELVAALPLPDSVECDVEPALDSLSLKEDSPDCSAFDAEAAMLELVADSLLSASSESCSELSACLLPLLPLPSASECDAEYSA